jgi:hypothetical protein
MALCGPKFLRGIKEPCDGSCCGLSKDGMPDHILTKTLNRRNELNRRNDGAWRRILGDG